MRLLANETKEISTLFVKYVYFFIMVYSMLDGIIM